VTRYLRLFAVQARTSISAAMAYRANFFIEGAITLIWTAVTLLPLVVVFGQRQTVAGWDEPQALIVVGYFLGVRAVLEGTISPSLSELVMRIRDGSFDYVLLKPVDAQAMVSTASYAPWRIFDLLGALALIGYAFVQRGAPPAPADAALGAVLFGCGVLAAYALWIVCAAASFWVVRMDNLMYLLTAVFDVGRWPIDVFRGAWRVVFTVVIPVAVMTTFPAEALLGRIDLTHTLATIGGALALLVISRLVWRTAIRNYTSASS
jgi:ABC-2 type transport system permease protein